MFGFKKRVRPYLKGRMSHPVARVLRLAEGYAMTVEKITITTGMNKNTVRSMLKKLVDNGSVGHKTPFFYWK